MWTAVTLACVYGAIFAGYVAWAWTRVAAGANPWPYVAAVPLIYLAIAALIVAQWFLLAWLYRAQRPREVRLSVPAVLRLYWHEFATIAGNAPRMIFYRWLMPDPPPAPAALPILLLHGVLCNAGVWHPFRRYLAREGIGPVYALSYGPPLAAIELFAAQAAAKIDAILATTGARQVIVIAHSMGGLVMRAYLREHGGARVCRLVTVGTPHEGSVHAWLGAGQCLAQMRPKSAWLAALGHPDGERMPPIVSLWSWHDSMVAPQTSSRVDFGDNVELRGVGHNALLRDPGVFARLAAEIETARAAVVAWPAEVPISRQGRSGPTSESPG
jgi:pimeloyl-ACP methyl ester carboxylesterase